MQLKTKILAAAGIIGLAGSYLLWAPDNQANSNIGNSPVAARAADVALLNMGENTIADIAQSIAPAVVNIEVDQEVSSPVASIPGFDFGQLPGAFKFFYNGQEVNPQQAPGGKGRVMPNAPKMERHNSGSGLIIRPDGYILTNAHVVRGASKIKVRLNDARVLPGKVVGIDNFSDIAVVKIDGTSFPTAHMGTSSNLRPGEFAIAIGNPLGLDHTVTLGIISAVKRSVTDVNGNINFIQTDAAINPGNSGGPLLNLHGDVIGINTAMQSNAQNIGFSIPIDIARDVADNLIANKKIIRPWLGLAMQELDETMCKSLGLPPGSKGVLIGQVIDGSPARAGGLEQYDVIQKIDGQDMTTAKQVQEYVRSHKVSDTLNFLVVRKNAPKAVAVNIGEYPEPSIAGNTDDDKPGAPDKPEAN